MGVDPTIFGLQGFAFPVISSPPPGPPPGLVVTPSRSSINTPQSYLEQAVVAQLRKVLGCAAKFCGRMLDGQPPAAMGQWFAAVWSDNLITTGSGIPSALDQYRDVCVTVSVRFALPFDRWVEHRDELETLANTIIAAVHQDSYSYVVTNAANVLGNYRSGGIPSARQSVGFVEGLRWQGSDRIEDKDPSWFHAKTESLDVSGISQKIRFGRARRIQSPANME